MWTGPAPMRPFNALTHPRGWRAFMEYGNGIMGDMCVHMLDMVRWMMDLPMPSRIASSGGIFADRTSKANITDTQTATFEFPDLRVHWTHRTWGDAPDPRAHPWGATFYGDKGTLEASVMGYSFYEPGKKDPSIHEDVVYELDRYPEDRTEKDLERHVAPPASSRTSRCSSDARSNGTTPRASSLAMKRPTGFSDARTAPRGHTLQTRESVIP
jgi:predicted dehydrogenase